MLITLQEYNQVIDGLRQQLILMRRFNSEQRATIVRQEGALSRYFEQAAEDAETILQLTNQKTKKKG